MKTPTVAFLALLTLVAVTERSSHAFGMCNLDHSVESCWDGSPAFWITSTTFTGPLALFFDGQIDLKNAEVRDLALSQAEQILNGQGAAINDSENLVRVLAKLSNVSDEKMAQVLKSLEASGSEISSETIAQALK